MRPWAALLLLSACAPQGKARLPVLVVPGAELSSRDASSIDIAVEYWVGVMGHGAVTSTDPTEGLVVPVLYGDLDAGIVGLARIKTDEDGCVLSAAIYLDADRIAEQPGPDMTAWVIAHELGHILGLSHYPQPSLMYRKAVPVLFDLSEDDAEEIARIYSEARCR